MAVYCGNDSKHIKYAVWANAEILMFMEVVHVFTNVP